MKKLVFATLTILALLFSLLPASTAFAKSGGSATISVRNQTGGNVTITLYSADGSKTLTYEVGTSFSTVGAGTYTFYAVTPCGVQSGKFNVNVNKTLYLSCNEGREVSLFIPSTPQYCYSVWDYPNNQGDPLWQDYGPHCQNTPANIGDTFEHEYQPGQTSDVWFYNSPEDACAPSDLSGPAYYYWDCSK